MADPLLSGSRLPLDPTLAKAAVDTAIKLLSQLSEGRQREPAWQEAKEAARALHMDIAAAEFDARLPRVRAGAELVGGVTPGGLMEAGGTK